MEKQQVLIGVRDLLTELRKWPEVEMGFWCQKDEETFVQFQKLVGEFEAGRIAFVSLSLQPASR